MYFIQITGGVEFVGEITLVAPNALLTEDLLEILDL